MYLISIDENLINIKSEIKLERKNRQNENEKLKQDLISSIRDIVSLSLEKEHKVDKLSQQED